MVTEVYPVLIDPETEFSTREQDVSDVDTTENTTIITLKNNTEQVTESVIVVLGTDVSSEFQIED